MKDIKPVSHNAKDHGQKPVEKKEDLSVLEPGIYIPRVSVPKGGSPGRIHCPYCDSWVSSEGFVGAMCPGCQKRNEQRRTAARFETMCDRFEAMGNLFEEGFKRLSAQIETLKAGGEFKKSEKEPSGDAKAGKAAPK